MFRMQEKEPPFYIARAVGRMSDHKVAVKILKFCAAGMSESVWER